MATRAIESAEASAPAIGSRAVLRSNLRWLVSGSSLSPELAGAVQEAFIAAEPAAAPSSVPPEPAGWVGSTVAGVIGRGVSPRGPVVVLGCAPPLLSALDAALAREERDGVFRRRVLLVDDRLDRVADALARFDLAGSLEHPERLSWFVGVGALQALGEWLDERIDDGPPELVVESIGVGDVSPIGAGVRRLLAGSRDRQQAILRELVALTESSGDSPETDAFGVRSALREAAAGRRSLRVLLCGSRYTSYVRHALEGLGVALRDLGHRAELLLERDEGSVLTTLAYRRAVHRLRPDLIVTPNYPRATLSMALPARIPHVCWLQDAMPHLFDPRVPERMGETELFIGNTLPELATHYGYPEWAMVPWCVPACESRFHDGPIADELRQRFECEVAFVSHHSEPPEAMRDRLIRECGARGGGAAVVRAVWEDLASAMDGEHRPHPEGWLEALIHGSIARCAGNGVDPGQLAMLRHRIALPLHGRMFRHQAVRWAAEICGRRGWRLRLHGNGWERTPGLSRFAGGAVEHGEPLRACYQSARVHLHLDPNTLTHQRVFECAMSGGLPVMRFAHSGLEALRHSAAIAVGGSGGRSWQDHESGQRYLEACAACGAEPGPIDAALTRVAGVRADTFDARTRQFDADWLCAGLGDVTFTDPASLERLLERAIEDGHWRDERSSMMGERMRATVGMRAFARAMIERAGDIIGWKSSCLRLGLGWPARADWDEFLSLRPAGGGDAS